VVLEFYENTKDPEDRRFRLIYNGKDRTDRVPFCSTNDASGSDGPPPRLIDIGEEARMWETVRDPNAAADEARPVRPSYRKQRTKDPDDLLPPAEPLYSMCPFDLLQSYVISGFFADHNVGSFDELCRITDRRSAPASPSRETVL
jgi:hypothetical protein